MADAIMTYAITAGIFVFLTAILFGSRAARKRSHGETSSENKHPEAAWGRCGVAIGSKSFHKPLSCTKWSTDQQRHQWQVSSIVI